MIRAGGLALIAVVALTGCAADDGTGLDRAPRPKPAVMTAAAKASPGGPLTRAQVSTMTGEILILEPDGSVTTMQLDSPQGRDAFAVSSADLAGLARGTPDLAALRGPGAARKSAQDQALEAFAERTGPALPAWRKGTLVKPEDFIAAQVKPLGRGDLVEVTANLREGVDADVAFSYATCALAGWARDNGAPYARHVRTLQDRRNGKLLIGAAFTLSQSQPMGLRVMETNETLRMCKDRGIPAA